MSVKTITKMTLPLSLGDLADPSLYRKPLQIGGCSKDFLRGALRKMMVIRRVEEEVGDLAESGTARTPCHLGIGQEAIAVGVSAHLTSDDRVFGTHRSHSHALALGMDVKALISEILGKADGASNGMGGSMHLYDADNGFHGSVPIVGATIPLAVGAGLAAKLDGSTDVGVCYFGDGTSEEGVFHESLNLASIFKYPVLFVCENNLYSSHLDVLYRQPYDRIARYAAANKLPAMTVDGNDVVAVAKAAEELLAHARSGGGPVFLEGVTYRWRGHVGPDANVDVGVRRSKEDVEAWMQRDPIRRLEEALIDNNMMDRVEISALKEEVYGEVRMAVEDAKLADYPGVHQIMDLVYADEDAAAGERRRHS